MKNPSPFPQKLTSRVFNDQLCECGDVGAVLESRLPRQNGLEKKSPDRVARSCAWIRFDLHQLSARPRSRFDPPVDIRETTDFRGPGVPGGLEQCHEASLHKWLRTSSFVTHASCSAPYLSSAMKRNTFSATRRERWEMNAETLPAGKCLKPAIPVRSRNHQISSRDKDCLRELG